MDTIFMKIQKLYSSKRYTWIDNWYLKREIHKIKDFNERKKALAYLKVKTASFNKLTCGGIRKIEISKNMVFTEIFNIPMNFAKMIGTIIAENNCQKCEKICWLDNTHSRYFF
jgi:hypothetical protein